ncbi:hypothetical protein AGMMS49938_07720 [Fibrobacterales bacterium]|nr:hypothetical protein AGMMS49938_07720 [Fibrobacterales bacterium]
MKYLFLTMLLFAIPAMAELKHVAVFDITADDDVPINQNQLLYITDDLRKQAIAVLAPPDYSVMTRDNILSLLPPDEELDECLAEEGNCSVNLGRRIGANYVTEGKVIMLSSNLLGISISIHDVLAGKQLGVITEEGVVADEGVQIGALLEKLRSKSGDFFAKVKGVQPAQPVITAPVAVVDLVEESPADKRKFSFLKTPKWYAVTLGVLGAGGIGFAVYQNSVVSTSYDDYKKLTPDNTKEEFKEGYQKVEDSKSRRNIGYIVGSALLAAGIGVHFSF